MKIAQISDGTLLGYARDPRIRGAMPLFRRLHKALGRTGGCRCRGRKGSLGSVLASVKASLVHGKGLAKQLKALTGAHKLVIHVREGKRIVRKEF